MATFRFGIIGPGMIAGALANAIGKSKNATLTAVSSRRLANAKAFAAKYPGAIPCEGVDALLARPDVDAVYIATPTTAKEPIALQAIASGKHVLVEKPFADAKSVERMTSAAAARGVLFMDATHFVHHPRTAAIQSALASRLGSPRSLHTAFYFPLSDRSNIRFDRTLEPAGVLGDLGWYSARAIVEYLRPQRKVSKALTVTELDPPTGTIIRAAGLIAFDGREVSTFDVGFTCPTVIMDLQLTGTNGVVAMDDFVLDWSGSWSFKDPALKAGYTYRTKMATRRDVQFIETPASIAQEVQMIDSFAEIARSGDERRRSAHAAATLRTQEILDAMWTAANQ
ncbi:MAG: Gfo/Idh/MocA family protein [Phycisphaerales bacterium]